MVVATKSALLDAAEKAVRSVGYNGFSYANLAEVVGIRKASIHYHFPTKASLSEALIQRYHENFEQTLNEFNAKHETASARFGELIAHYRSALNNGHAMCLCVSLSATRDDLPEATIDALARFRLLVTDWLAQNFERALVDQTVANVMDSQMEAASALALLEGAHLAARTEKDVAMFDKAVHCLRARLS